MKILLAVMISTVMASSAFGECSVTSIKECSSEQACKGLEKGDIKVTFDGKRDIKCQIIPATQASATECAAGDDTKRTTTAKVEDVKTDKTNTKSNDKTQ